MAYQLKSTGVSANCTMCIAVDPDTGTIKDFASSAVTADIVVGANVTVGSQAWDGNTRSYFKLGAGTAAADFVAFGTTKPNWTFNVNGQTRTVVWIGEHGTGAVRVIGSNSSHYFSSQNTSSGGATYPNWSGCGQTSNTNGAQSLPAAGTKVIFGFSATHGTSATAYWAVDTDASMSSAVVTTPTSTGTGNNFDIAYVGRRDDSTAHGSEKIHAILIFNAELTSGQWDSLRDDWFGTLLEQAGADSTAPTLTSPTSASTGSTTGDGTVTTDEANGTLYAVVTTVSTPPSGAQVRAGQDATGAAAAWANSQAVSSTGAKTFNATGLTPSTTYYFHFQHRDAASNDSAVSSAASFTTEAATTGNPVVVWM